MSAELWAWFRIGLALGFGWIAAKFCCLLFATWLQKVGAWLERR